MQTTLLRDVTFTGVGLHSGKPARLRLRPAAADHGIRFRRSDLGSGRDADVPALWDHVRVTPLNTRIENTDGVAVQTIEHLMAACAGTGLHNVLVEIDGPEVPILDGSSAPFVRGILEAGRQRLSAPLRVFRILAPIEVRLGEARARLEPSMLPEMMFEIDFPDEAIGQQELGLNLSNGAFVRELCDSRTFCRAADVEAMHRAGLALGGSIDNAVVVSGAHVLTPGGLRHPNEAVRHKMLDAVGDLYTAGAPIVGRYKGYRAGHAVTNALLHEMMARPDCWTLSEASPSMARRLPGSGLAFDDLHAVA